MTISNIEEHFNCYCYDSGKLQKPLVDVWNLKRSQEKEFTSSTNEIIFVVKGNINFTLLSIYKSRKIEKGHFIFLPAGGKVRCKAFASSQMLLMRLTDSINLCNMYSIEQLYSEMNNIEKPEGIFALNVNPRLQHFVEGLVHTWNDGLKCRNLFIADITKILTIIRHYYSKEELCWFFYSVLSPNTAFSKYVRMHHLKFRNVKDIAKSMNMSSQQFSRRFVSVFNQPPFEWMQQEKARLIYNEICTSEKPYKEIASDFGFSLQENFIRFCRTVFGAIPSDIRKRVREKGGKS